MRTKKTLINTVVSFASQFIIILLGFISRRVLIYNVGVQYLGINGLMSNILTVFSLAESGIGVAIALLVNWLLPRERVNRWKAAVLEKMKRGR